MNTRRGDLRRRQQLFKYVIPRERREGRSLDACGKICYPTRGVARSHLKNFQASGLTSKYPDGVAELRVYHCARCSSWHLGHRILDLPALRSHRQSPGQLGESPARTSLQGALRA